MKNREEELKKFDEEAKKERELLLTEEKKTKCLPLGLGVAKSKTFSHVQKSGSLKGRTALTMKEKATESKGTPKITSGKKPVPIFKKKEEAAKSPTKSVKRCGF